MHKPFITDTYLIRLAPVVFGMFPGKVAITGATDDRSNTKKKKKKRYRSKEDRKIKAKDKVD